MIEIDIEDIKGFMGKLLSDSFDEMLLYKADVKTATTLSIDGILNKAFYDSEDELGDRKYALWQEIKGVFFQAIRGKKLPLSFKISLMPDGKLIESMINREAVAVDRDNISALFMNIIYERGRLAIITGSSYKTFSLDKTVDRMWDKFVTDWMKYYNF